LTTNKSKQTKKKLSGQPESSSRSKLLLAEGALIGWVALCLILLLALLSYSPDDPGWSHTGSREGVANLIGPAGAWMSDISFALFGL